MTVIELRENDYQVRVRHTRRTLGDRIAPQGGLTEVEIITPDGQTLRGRAKCSDLDNFNKRLGVRIAIGRALKGTTNETILS